MAPPPPESLTSHGPALRALARRLVGEAAAEDLVQEAWLAALRRPPRDPGALRAWLLRVTARAAANHHRGIARRAAREHACARAEAVPAAAEVAGERALARALRRGLERLGEPYRTVLHLRFYEDLPPRAIARRTGRPVETVRCQVRRGLARLRAELRAETGDRRAWGAALLPLVRRPRRLVPAALVAAAAVTVAVVIASVAIEAGSPGRLTPPRVEATPAVLATAGPDDLERRIPRRRIGRPPVSSGASRPASLPASTSRPPAGETGLLYRLRVEGARAGAPLFARLAVEGDPRATEHHVPVAIEWVPDGTALVRFPAVRPPSQTRNATRAALRLTVASPDGLQAGAARVHPWDGEYPRPVRVRLEPRAALAGTVREAGGAPLGDVELRVGCRTVARTDGAGRFRAGGLAEGAATVVARATRHASVEEGVVLVAGERASLDLVLAPLPTGRVAGRLTSRTGTHRPRGDVRLRSVAEPWRELRATPFEALGGWRFVFEEVPAGEVEVLPPLGDHRAWSPARLRVGVPASSLVFECQDDGPTGAIAVRARDARTGEPLEGARFALLVDRERRGTEAAVEVAGTVTPRPVSPGSPAATGVPSDLPLAWVVEADGFRSVRGTRADLVREGERLVADVALEPAPRLVLWFGTGPPSEGGRPLEGVAVCAGDAVLGRSGADGHLVLELVYDPGPLRARLAGWEVGAWHGFEDGRRVEARRAHHVYLRETEANG